MSLKQHIPNSITSLNLLSGCFAIYFAFEHQYNYVAYAVFLAAIFDFLDGFSARLLKVSSPMGKELDSLADMVTFGVAPAMLVFNLLRDLKPDYPILQSNSVLLFVPFLIAVFSGLRLAKFNIDTRQTTSFIGLPTPANALFWVSLPFINYFPTQFPWIAHFYEFALTPGSLIVLSIIFSVLLVSELHLFALKFSSFGWKSNEIKYLFLITCGILLAALQLLAIPFIIILYIIISIIFKTKQ